MKYCTKCVMFDTRLGIKFDENRVCTPCLNHEKKKLVNWEERMVEFKEFCNKYKEMNPLLVSVEGNFPITEAVKLVNEKDSNLDSKCIDDFCEFLDYSKKKFWDIVEKLYNQEIFCKNDLGEWKLKNPLK